MILAWASPFKQHFAQSRVDQWTEKNQETFFFWTVLYLLGKDVIINSFTDFSLIKLPPETDFFLRMTPEVAPGHNTGYSYGHAHKLKMQDKIASMSLACNEISPLQLMHVHMWNSHKCEIGKGRVKKM